MTARSIATDGLFDFIKTTAPSPDAALQRLQAVANVLDSAFVIPGTRQRVGIDAIIGLIPGLSWAGGGFETVYGRRHMPNLPTEEVFTTPDPTRTEGVV